jgi:hypothetical protein
VFSDLDYIDVSSGAAAGADGSAIASADSSRILTGAIHAVSLTYDANAPATTDVTITALADSDGLTPNQTVLVELNNKTNGVYYPRVQACDINGGAIAGEYTEIISAGHVRVGVAQANTGSVVQARVWFKRLRG